ncbi:MAG: lytic transglycosylase domain-containing protein [Clostridiales bacterium]|nr:lytic transglycosylase domain-containing protein [Clostridiales bacterium]
MKRNKNKKAALIKSVAVIAVIAVIIAIAAAVSYDSLEKSVYPMQYTQLIEKYAKEYELPVSLVYAVIRTESSFNPEAVSSANAKGLMQITPDTFDWLQTKTGDKNLAQEELFDPETAIRYGTFFLRYLTDEFENTEAVLAAYHAGRTRVNGWLKNAEYSDDGKTLKKIPYADTASYVATVTSAMEKYQEIYDLQ